MGVTTSSNSAATMVPITRTTLGSTSSSVTLSSIPSTYTDLVLVVNGQNTSSDGNWRIQFNSDTGSNYSFTYLAGTGSATESGRYSNVSSVDCGVSGNGNWATMLVNINNYVNSTTYKTSLSRLSSSSRFVTENAGLWRSTATINSVTILNDNSWATGSTFTLYGIKAA